MSGGRPRHPHADRAVKLAAGNSYELVAQHLGMTRGQVAGCVHRARHGNDNEWRSDRGHHGPGPHWFKHKKRRKVYAPGGGRPIGSWGWRRRQQEAQQ